MTRTAEAASQAGFDVDATISTVSLATLYFCPVYMTQEAREYGEETGHSRFPPSCLALSS
jgi:hypothetical protein